MSEEKIEPRDETPDFAPVPDAVRYSLLKVYEDHFGSIDKELEDALKPVIDSFQTYLEWAANKSLESFEANQRVAALIQRTAEKLGVALACPKPGCGKPSKIRCTKSGRSAKGYFSFEHLDDKGERTKHGGTNVIPLIRLLKIKSE